MIAERDVYNNQTAILYWLKAQGHLVEFVRDYGAGPRPAPSSAGPVPAEHVKPPPTPGISHLRREAVGEPCPYCEIPMTLHGRKSRATKDHVIPKIHGGKLTDRNRLIVCIACNGDKSSRTLEQWLAYLEVRGDRRAMIVAALIVKRSRIR